MAVVKMKYMNIMADIDMFDEVVDNYLSRYDVEYENAMAENPKMSGLSPISYTSRYVDVLKMAESLNLPETPIDAGQMATDEAVRLINAIYQKQKDVKEQRAALLERKQQFGEFMEQAQTLFGIALDFTRLYNMEYVKFRYGRMPVDSQRKLELYIEKNLNAVFVPGAVKNGYVYGIYLMPATCEEKVDAVFFSLHFERIRLLDELSGSPEEAYAKAEDEIVEIDRQIFALSEAVDQYIAEYGEKAHMAYQKIKDMNARYCLRKFAAKTENELAVSVFILSGWMTETDAKDLEKRVSKNERVMCVIEDYKDMEGDKKPPIKLKNFFLFRPFEMYVKMYGLPTYGEIDPTAFVAITYAILFGMMFGDVGQGLLLVVGGFLFYRLKKLDLGAIISLSGVFSILFGFMYGSVFGNEEIMEQYGLGPLWVNPLKSEGTMTLLLTAVAIGVVLILAAMLLNICNLIKTKHYGKMLVDTNGIAGMVFYVTVLAMALSVLTGAFHVAAWIGGTLIAISLLAILFRERLTRMIENKDKFMPAGGIGMYITEAFFELFEILLSFVTNTISFIRIGGFALSHAGMMQVVYLLAEGANGYNPVVIILGNLLVMGIEGLIVGIQVLRLEFYEMFSRFYNGGGKPFMPYKLKNN